MLRALLQKVDFPRLITIIHSTVITLCKVTNMKNNNLKQSSPLHMCVFSLTNSIQREQYRCVIQPTGFHRCRATVEVFEGLHCNGFKPHDHHPELQHQPPH